MLLQTLRSLAFPRQRLRQAALSLRCRLRSLRSRRIRVRFCMKRKEEKSHFPSPIARFWWSIAGCARCFPPGPAIKTRSRAYRHLELHAHFDQLVGELLVRGLQGLDRGSYAITRLFSLVSLRSDDSSWFRSCRTRSFSSVNSTACFLCSSSLVFYPSKRPAKLTQSSSIF